MDPVCFSNELGFIYNLWDSEYYYLSEFLVESGINHILSLYENEDTLLSTIDFIKYSESIKRDKLLNNKILDLNNLIFLKNKEYRLKYGDWAHHDNIIYDEFYYFINGNKKYEI